jgi:hypothetical protein
MAKRPINKKKISAKPRRNYGDTGSTRQVDPPKPTENTDKNLHVEDLQKVTETYLEHEPGQTAERIDSVKPPQEPLIKASELFTFKKRTLSTEARELLAKIDEGGIPWLLTQNLERIAKENGIEISAKMTPNDIIRRLRNLA